MPHEATLTICLAAAIGVGLIVAAHRLHLPSIVLLLVGGVLAGPECLGLIDPASLGGGLDLVIALAVAVILFEGGLTLNLAGTRESMRAIGGLLTIGVLVTWLGSAVVVHFLFEVSWDLSLLAGSLIIVTGPTVVLPLLRRISIPKRLHHLLYWEAVLIDAVGVTVAVLCYEWLSPDPGHPMWSPPMRFALRLLLGLGLGALVGLLLSLMLERDWIPREHANIAVLAAALLTFVVAHEILSESGILAVVVAGFILGWRRPPQLASLRHFKLQLTEVGIGLLFVLLAAHLELRRFADPRLLILLPVVLFVLRPLAVLLSTMGQGYSWSERALLSWIAPRGIVAASMASLFALRLKGATADAALLETVTYSVIAATVTLQGLSAGAVAGLLGLRRSKDGPWVLCGSPTIVESVGRGLRLAGVTVAEVDPLQEELDLDDPSLASAQGFLACDITMLRNVWSISHLGKSVQPRACFRWATFEGPPKQNGTSAGTVVWEGTHSALAVAEGLAAGSHTVDVIDVGEAGPGRLGPAQRPLFWVRDGEAEIVPALEEAVAPDKGLAVVLRRRISGLGELIESVQIAGGPLTCAQALELLAPCVARRLSGPEADALREELLERQTMTIALNDRAAVAHVYTDQLESSGCYLAVVPRGIKDVLGPRGKAVQMLFWLVSPTGNTDVHLKAVSNIASLAQDDEFMLLLTRQSVPQRVLDLIGERA